MLYFKTGDQYRPITDIIDIEGGRNHSLEHRPVEVKVFTDYVKPDEDDEDQTHTMNADVIMEGENNDLPFQFAAHLCDIIDVIREHYCLPEPPQIQTIEFNESNF